MASIVPDIRDVQIGEYPRNGLTIDWRVLADGTLDDRQALATAVVVALGTNALASTDDILPDPDSTNRMGWWGDLEAPLIWGGWPIGSKLWLLSRAKMTPATALEGSILARVEDYIRDAIQPFVDLRIASSFDIWVTRVDKQRIDALIRIYRGPLKAVDLLYQVLWDELVQDQE